MRHKKRNGGLKKIKETSQKIYKRQEDQWVETHDIAWLVHYPQQLTLASRSE